MKKYAFLFIILLNNLSFAQSDIFKSNIVVYETGVLDDDNNITYFNNHIASSLEEIEKNQIIIKKYKNNYYLIIDQNLWSGEIGEVKNTRVNDFSLKTSFLWAIKSEDDYIPATVILRQEKNEKFKIIDTYMLVIFDNKNIFEFKGPSISKEIIEISELQ
ncbi:hypothetical protein [Empedobacter falsenii]|uniref:hypothetical protein n=1 Tax=Empedobacter falsenii TaxID=343874 RepID=UPI001C56329D|nr:hypothetical protein [Empedobacter falsenii]MBW1618156.1 hypothetical protein [Empedobacter falsenii]